MTVSIVCVVAAALVVGVVVLVALCGWGGRLSPWQRHGLLTCAGGLVMAGPDRFLQRPPGLGDLIFLGGLLAYLLASYGPALWRRADEADGHADGKVTVLRPKARSAAGRGSGAAVVLAVVLAMQGGDARASAYEAFTMRAALRGPGRVAVVELGRHATREACESARRRLMEALEREGGRLTTPDGLTWTVLGVRCVAQGQRT